MDTKARLFTHDKDGETGVVVANKITRSTKTSGFKVMLALAVTQYVVLAIECECHADGSDNKKVVYVHTCSLLYEFTVLLDDASSEHLIVEQRSCWNPALENLVVTQGRYKSESKYVHINATQWRYKGEDEQCFDRDTY